MAKIFNHVDKRVELGFTYLALAWTDGFSTFPLDFALMSSKKDEYCFNNPEHMDTRKSSDKRKKESRLSKPEVVLQMIKKFWSKELRLIPCFSILGSPQRHW